MMLPRLLSIDINFGLLIDSFEVKLHDVGVGCGKRLAVLALAGLEPSATSTRSAFS